MKTMLNYLIRSLFKQDQSEPKNFFDYPAREKKRIIVSAAREAAKIQAETVRQYEARFSAGK